MDNTIGRDMLIKSGKMSLVSILFVSIIPSIPQKSHVFLFILKQKNHMALYMTYFFSFDSITYLFLSVNCFFQDTACVSFLIMIL